MDTKEIKALIQRVKDKTRVTKVVATRSFKTRRGDFFSGFSAAWDSVQDDGGGQGAGLDLITTTAEESQSGMTLQEARVAHLLVSVQADIGAYEAAFANSAISRRELDAAVAAIKNNYGNLIRDALKSQTTKVADEPAKEMQSVGIFEMELSTED